MKLHLPKMLTVALLSACAAISANAAVPYTGTVYTWDTQGSKDFAYGRYVVTTYDDQGNPTVTDEAIDNNFNTLKTVFGSENIQIGNTLRFDSTHGQQFKTPAFGFSPLTLGGIIVEEGATGFSIRAGASGYDRIIRLGNLNGSASYNDINEDFSINKTAGGNTLYLRGQETFDVATGKTFTLKSNNDINFAGSLTVTGGGTVDFAQGATVMAAGSSVTVNSGSTLTYASSLTMAADSTITNAGALTLNGTVKLGAAGIANTGSITLGNNIVFDLSQMQAVENKYTLFSGNGLDLSKLTTDNITGITTAGKTFTFGTDGTISYTVSGSMTWTAQLPGYWNYTDANWDGGVFVENMGAKFVSDAIVTVNADVKASSIEVTDTTTLYLGAADGGKLTSAALVLGDGAQLMASTAIEGLGEFSVGAGAVWGISADQTLGKGTNGGTISVADGYTVRLTNADNAKDLLLGIIGSGNISVGVDNLTITGGAEATAPASHATGKLIVEEGKKLIIGSGKATYVNLTSFSGIELGKNANLETNVAATTLKNLTVGEGSHTLHLADTDNYNRVALDLQGTTTLNGDLKLTSGWKYNVNIAKLTGEGGLELTGGNEQHKVVIGDADIKTINVSDNMTEVQLNGTVNLTGNLTLKKGTTTIAGTTTVGADLDLSVGGASTGTLQIAETGVVNVTGNIWNRNVSHLLLAEGGQLHTAALSLVGGADGGELGTSEGNTYYQAGDATYFLSGLAVTAKQDVTIANELAFSSIDAGTHTVALTNADNMISAASVAEGGSLSIAGGSLGSSIVNEGSVTLTGNIDITMMEYKDSSTYTGGAAPGNVNGFETLAAEYALSTGNGTLDFSGASIYFYEQDVTNDVTNDGKYYVSSAEPDYTTFYVNEQSETVTQAKSGPVTLESIVVRQNGTLEVDQDINTSLIGATSAGTVQIGSGHTVTSDGSAKHVTLTGTGTYVLEQSSVTDNLITMPDTLGEDWNGIVQIHNVTTPNNKGEVFTNLAKNGSIIELKGFSGLTDKWIGDQTENIKLTNSDERGYAWYFSGATMYEGNTAAFSGNWSGDGTLQTAGNNLNYKFTGDVSDWTGMFQVASGAPDLTFSGSATEVNASIDKNGKTLHLIVGEGSEFATTFNAAVDATSLTVADNAAATFDATATFGSLSGTGKVALGEDSTLTVTGTVGGDVQIEAADGATIDADISASQAGIKAGATVSFVNGVSDDINGVSFQNEDTTAVAVENKGVEKLYYGIDKETAKVTADNLLYTGAGEDTVVANEVVVNSVQNMDYEGSKLTLTHVDTEALQNVDAFMGDVTLQNVNADPVMLENLSLLGTTVAVYQGTEEVAAQEGTVTITDTLTAGGGTLLANLTMADGSTLDLSLMEGGIQALTLGSQFTIDDGALVKLDVATLAAIAGLENIGDKVILIQQYEDHALTTNLTDGDWSRTHFDLSSITGADYQLFVQDGQIGLVKSSMVPEPTTGTLSLLALAALAARRRKH